MKKASGLLTALIGGLAAVGASVANAAADANVVAAALASKTAFEASFSEVTTLLFAIGIPVMLVGMVWRAAKKGTKAI